VKHKNGPNESRTGESWSALISEAGHLGKQEWREMLVYLANLHKKGTHPPNAAFPFPWEEIGPGYHSLAFGHWDIVHAVLDVMDVLPGHAEQQILNDLSNQESTGLIPGAIWLASPRSRPEPARWNKVASHPPLWPVAADEIARMPGRSELLPKCYEALIRQIGWFEAFRRAEPAGFFYSRTTWESGLDDDHRQTYGTDGAKPLAFVDATSHVYNLYNIAAQWAARLGKQEASARYRREADGIGQFVRRRLFDDEAGFFYDIWAVEDRAKRVESFVGMWPVVVGIATHEQAYRVIDKHLLNTRRFFCKHPISTIAVDAPEFELLTWRGPTWNSMSYWAARGCLRYGRGDAARLILERALDATAIQFQRTGTIWEYYHPHGGRPEDLMREVTIPHGIPCRDYIGHNPLFAMARLYERAERGTGTDVPGR
jgi:putative isomerase